MKILFKNLNYFSTNQYLEIYSLHLLVEIRYSRTDRGFCNQNNFLELMLF
jgi:hypothetical protein